MSTSRGWPSEVAWIAVLAVAREQGELRDEHQAVALPGGGFTGGQVLLDDELVDDAMHVARHRGAGARVGVGDGDVQGCGLAEHLIGGEWQRSAVGVGAQKVDRVAVRLRDRLMSNDAVHLQRDGTSAIINRRAIVRCSESVGSGSVGSTISESGVVFVTVTVNAAVTFLSGS